MGLAPVLVDQIFDVIKELNAKGTTILLVEQNALMALSIAHRAYVLQTGSIVLSGTAESGVQGRKRPKGVPRHLAPGCFATRRYGMLRIPRSAGFGFAAQPRD